MRRQPVPQYETDWPVQLSSPPLSNAAATGSASHQRPSSGGSGSSVSSADRYESGYGWPAPVSRSVVLPQTNNNASQDQLRGRENLPNDPEQARGLEEKPVRPEYSERRQTSHVRDTGFRAWIHRAVSSKLQWAYLAVLAVQAVVILALEGTLFGLIAARVSTSSNEMQAIQVIYQLALAFDALRLKNTLQLYGILLFQCAMLAYAALMPDQLRDALQSIGRLDVWDIVEGMLIAIPIVLGVSVVVSAIVTARIQHEMGWSVFKLLGASLDIKRMFFHYQILVTLLKFDFFFAVGFACQFIILVTGRATYELALTILGMPLLILIFMIGAISVRKESRVGMAVYATGLIAAMVYFIWKLVRIYTAKNANGTNPYQSNQRSLTLFSAVSIALLAATMISSLLVLLNFGRGLKEAMPSYAKWTRRRRQGGHQGASPVEEDRISID